jgi:hypothetical protein
MRRRSAYQNFNFVLIVIVQDFSGHYEDLIYVFTSLRAAFNSQKNFMFLSEFLGHLHSHFALILPIFEISY